MTTVQNATIGQRAWVVEAYRLDRYDNKSYELEHRYLAGL